MFSKLGIASMLAGAFVGIFSIISKFMQADNIWVDITLSSLTGDLSDTIVDAVSIEVIHDFLYALFYEFPLGAVILVFGLICFAISLFVKEH